MYKKSPNRSGLGLFWQRFYRFTKRRVSTVPSVTVFSR